MTTLSRVAAFFAEQARNLFPDGASPELLARAATAAEARGPCRADDRIPIGPKGRQLSVSRLAVGSGTDGWLGSSEQTRKLGLKGLSDLYLHAFHQHNLNFWETADQYGSHPHVGKALKQVPRDKIVILTKTVAETPEAMRRDLDRFRQELGTDHIDILLLHCMTSPTWPGQMRGVMDVISEAQAEGIVGLKGVSCHTFSALEATVDEAWVEVDLARINPGGLNMDAGPDRVVVVLERMKQAKKAVLGMKILGNGKLAEHRAACLRFALGLHCVDAFTIGFESRGQLDDVVRLIQRAIPGAAQPVRARR
ncbi:MAG: aldo/keto reductase [Opitutaceae bacterium]